MKLILSGLLSLLLVGFNAYAEPIDKTKYTWSYAALADVTNDMYKYCSRVQLPELTKHGDFLVSMNARASKEELVVKCITESPFFDVIDMNKQTCKEHMIMPGTIYSVGGKKSDGCNLFITNLIDRQKKVKKMYNSPGTYVSEIKLTSGRSVYKVDNVVLASGYRDASGNTNFGVNTNDNNTHIYKRQGDTYVRTGLHTWTNDMFMDIQNGNGTKGLIRGARVGAYVYYDEDMTQRIYDLYNENRGLVGASLVNAAKSRPGGSLDIKAHYRGKYKVKGQDDGKADGNAFLFRGKIATLDFLGNMLYGMNVQEAAGPNLAGDAMAELVSLVSSENSHWYKGYTDGENESQWVKTGWKIGKDLVTSTKKQRKQTFAGVKTDTEQEAFNKSIAEIRRLYPNAGKIKCSGRCKKMVGTDDVVSCVYGNGDVIEFVFDSICSFF